MTKKDQQIKKAYMEKINEHGAEKVFLAQCQKFADYFGNEKGIYGKANYKKAIAAAYEAFTFYGLPIPTKKLNELIANQ